jgi:adenosine/AMP kinase
LTQDVDLSTTLQQIVDQINAQFGASSDLATTITNLLNDVASLGNIDTKINDAIGNAKDDIKAQLNSYITKAYNKLNSIFSKAPNRALQPVLVAKSGDKISLLSRSKSNPTKVSGSSLTLIPTSYTLELFAPAYKKFIAVTDVWDAAGNPAAASVGQAANGDNMLKVIDSEKTCTINGQAGYTYEIAYSAIDYHGKVVIKRFYVKF